MLNWYRSYPSPSEIAERSLNDVPHVIDNLPKMLMSNYDYRTVGEYNSLQTADGWPEESPGFCMLEWDIALDPWAQRAFAAEALVEPREILVSPYRYHDTWCMFVGNDGSGPTNESRAVRNGEERCDSFGLGCIYIPRIILNEYLPTINKFGFSDSTFGRWYHEKYGEARVTWKVHPQHLHDYPSQ